MNHAIDYFENFISGAYNVFTFHEYDSAVLAAEQELKDEIDASRGHVQLEGGIIIKSDEHGVEDVTTGDRNLPGTESEKIKFYDKLRLEYRQAIQSEIKSRAAEIKSEEELRIYINQQHNFAISYLDSVKQNMDYYEDQIKKEGMEDVQVNTNRFIDNQILLSLVSIIDFIQSKWERYINPEYQFSLTAWSENNNHWFQDFMYHEQNTEENKVLAKDMANIKMQFIDHEREALKALKTSAEKKSYLHNKIKYYKQRRAIPSATFSIFNRAYKEYVLPADNMITFLQAELESLDFSETEVISPPNNKRMDKIQKGTPFLKWQKNSVLLAYLLNELKTHGFIDDTDIWKISEEIFRDKKGEKIKNTTFTSFVKTYENNQTPDGTKGKPIAHAGITNLIESLRKISEEIK